jgi:hypothetical protein
MLEEKFFASAGDQIPAVQSVVRHCIAELPQLSIHIPRNRNEIENFLAVWIAILCDGNLTVKDTQVVVITLRNAV